ncbi:MAG: DUF4907 domain-containing protein [Bacteroidetes bacterium]|nr:DUF4907 domain-containing protein [Bacteroidota bacterium]
MIGIGVVVGYGIYRRKQWKKEHVYVELKAIQTNKGWGYDILTDGKIFIHQDIVPAIAGGAGRGFRTKEDALAVGQKVYERVVAGQMPMVSAEEVKAMGIVPADSVQ